MLFTFVAAGFEGSLHDNSILRMMKGNNEFCFPLPPPLKYYLADSGYTNEVFFLTPYRGQRYHLEEYHMNPHMRSSKECFNHRHSSLRSVIERCFGIWKAKFSTITQLPWGISWKDQVLLVPATMAICNFIRRIDQNDQDFNYFE